MTGPDYRSLCIELLDALENDGYWEALCQRARAALAQPAPLARPDNEYHEDMGAVLWWCFPIDEPPYCGSPLDSYWPGYHTHFTQLGPMPTPANITNQEGHSK
jgi:hypothetical protein